LDEAVGSNTVLSLSNLNTMQAVIDGTRHSRKRGWFDDSIPTLLTGTPAGLPEPNGEKGDESWGAAVEVEGRDVPHPYQEGITALATQTRETREAWSARLVSGIRNVNDMITNPALKLTYS
jgi:hypothetical protein